MATVTQAPDILSLSGNLKNFKISGTNQVRFRLLKGASLLLDQRYEPGTDALLEINIKDVVNASLSYLFDQASTSYLQPDIAADFTGEVDGIAYNFRAIRSGVARLSDTAANWLKGHFLSWEPKVKEVTYYTPEWLTYYAVQAVNIKLLATMADGSTLPLTIGSASAGQCITLNVQYASISGRLGNKYPTHYKVWAESTTGVRLTEEQIYALSETKSEDEEWYIFENSLGGVDTFRAYGINEFDGAHTHNVADFGDTQKEYEIDITRSYTKNTGYLDEYQRSWLLDFFPSKAKYIYSGNAIRKIVVTESSVKNISSELPSAYTFTYKFADITPFLNLIRNESELPANITVPNLYSPDFILPPRLVEFPRIQLSEGVLFPAFDPNSPSSTVTTFGAIKQTIVDEALQKVPTTGVPGTGTMVILLDSADESTEPSDVTVFTSSRTMKEITKALSSIPANPDGNFLRKDVEDIASEQISFKKGIKIGNAIFTWDVESNALKISESIYSEKEVSAYGAGVAGSSGGSGSLGGLINVGAWADEVPTENRIMVQLAGDTHWSSRLLTEISGLDTAALGDYLTTNQYATQSYVSTKVAELIGAAPETLDTLNELASALGNDPNFATSISTLIGTKWTQDNAKIANWDSAYSNSHTHVNKALLDLLTQDNLNVLSHFSVVDGNIKVDTNFWSTGEISAYGAGSGAGGSSGLITSVIGSAGLGGSYLNSDLTNTFNAYTINLINNNLTTALGRIGALETSAPYAITANRLANVRTIWGQNFDGNANVMGNISGSWFAINDVAANPYLKLLENSNSWYLQGYQNKLYLGSGTANSLVLDSVGNAGIVGALTANRVNTISESHMSVGAYVDPASGIGAALKVNGNFAAGGNSYFSGGNVLIGTLVNSTYRLDVNGATRIFGGLHLNSEGWLNLYNGANTSRISLSHNSDASKLDIYNRTTGTWATVQCGNIETQTISLYNDQIERFIRSNVFGGAIRLRGNSATASDRGIRLGRVDNSLGWLSQLAISADTGNVMIGTTTDAGYKLDVNGAFRSVGAASLNSTLNVGDLSTLKGVTVTNGTYSKAISVGSNSHLQVAGVVDSFTYTLPATIGWYRIAVSPVGVERPFGQFDVSWTLSSYHGSVSLTAGMMYSSSPFLSVSDYTNFGICMTKSRIVYHTTYSGNYAYLEVYNETGKAVSLTVRGYNLYNWSLYSTSTVGSIPSGYSNKEIVFTSGYATSGNISALGEVTAYSASDIRLKENIYDITNGLEVINKIRPVVYNWNSAARELNTKKGYGRDSGFIAQELKGILPDHVHYIYGTYLSIDYIKIIPYLVGAIKELTKKINIYEKRKCA